MKRKKRKEPEKGKWRRRYLQLFLNQSNAERDKDRKDRLVLMFYTKAFQINMKKAKQQAKYVFINFYFFLFILYYKFFFFFCNFIIFLIFFYI